VSLAVRILCRPETAPGFELAGARVDRVADAAAARARLAVHAADPTVGVVLVEEPLHRALPQDMLLRLERQPRPIVATLPAPRFDAVGAAEQALLDILQRAIGYRVRLPT
jgi:vacuolar-type H+-ATPase subunit F/Vma7